MEPSLKVLVSLVGALGIISEERGVSDSVEPSSSRGMDPPWESPHGESVECRGDWGALPWPPCQGFSLTLLS